MNTRTPPRYVDGPMIARPSDKMQRKHFRRGPTLIVAERMKLRHSSAVNREVRVAGSASVLELEFSGLLCNRVKDLTLRNISFS